MKSNNYLTESSAADYSYIILYHAIENTANQNAGKPSYIRRYYTQPSHDALRFYSAEI